MSRLDRRYSLLTVAYDEWHQSFVPGEVAVSHDHGLGGWLPTGRPSKIAHTGGKK